jgi:diguanylate cyclase
VIFDAAIWLRLRWLWVTLVLVGVGAGAVAGISHFRSSADDARRAEFALRDAHTDLYAASAAAWRAVARNEHHRRPFAAPLTEATDDLRPLAQGAGPSARDAGTLLRDIDRYRTAVSAANPDEQVVDALFARADAVLSRAIVASEAQRAAAEHRAVSAARLIVVSAAVVMLLTLGLYARARRSTLRAQLEQESLKGQVVARGFEADHDELTNLLNRRGFFARLRARIGDGDALPFAVLVLDLDGFKEINDTLGHGAGDALLAQIGPRLRSALRETDTLARLGGDEFAILTDGACTVQGSAELGRRIRASLVAPIEVAGLALQVRASIGVAHFPEHGPSAEELVRRADIAMYQAKHSKSGVAVYAAADDPRTRHGLQLASDLERGIRAGQLVVHYQPKADLSSGSVTGVEALVRWQHPDRGLLAPDTFVPIAERNGLIRELTLEVVRIALAQQARWRGEGIDLSLAVNLSIANLLDTDLPFEIAELLARQRGRAEGLRFEITESYLVTDPTLIHSNLQRLCDQGIRLALDDFGTGYSSFTHLRRLPIDELKIDRSFIEDLDREPDDAVIVRSTIDLAHSLSLSVVAEGVETEAVWNQLRELGCDQAQGYYLSAPLPAHSLTGWLLRRPADTPYPTRRA